MISSKLIRRIFLVGLAAAPLLGCGRASEDTASADAERGRRINAVGPGRAPTLDFPKRLRCPDEEVNTFIEDFYRTCCEGEYDQFRLMMSTRVDPFTPQRFKKALEAVDVVQIIGVERLPDVADVPPPVYLVRAEVRLRPNSKSNKTKMTVAIVVFKEVGKWVMAPAPPELRDGLDALYESEGATSQQAASPEGGDSEPSASTQ